jgi:hypothetical protein
MNYLDLKKYRSATFELRGAINHIAPSPSCTYKRAPHHSVVRHDRVWLPFLFLLRRTTPPQVKRTRFPSDLGARADNERWSSCRYRDDL